MIFATGAVGGATGLAFAAGIVADGAIFVAATTASAEFGAATEIGGAAGITGAGGTATAVEAGGLDSVEAPPVA